MQVLIVDDHPLYREALRSTIGLAFPAATIDEAETVLSAVDALERTRGTDLILLDLSMQGVTGFDGLMAIRRRFPKVPVLVVSGLDEPAHHRGCDALRGGRLRPRNPPRRTRLTQAITAVLTGSLAFPRSATLGLPGRSVAPNLAARIAQLTPQQFRVLLMIRQGKLNKQIAHELTGRRFDGEGPCDGDPAQTRRRQPNADRDRDGSPQFRPSPPERRIARKPVDRMPDPMAWNDPRRSCCRTVRAWWNW